MPVSPLAVARRSIHLATDPLPAGRIVLLSGRGTTYVTDTPGPGSDAPPIVLLHALGCTGLLTWFPAIAALATRFRVITLDQRGHGRGIPTDDFRLPDCADDVAALLDALGLDRAVIGGYSLGSVVAQRTWRQHPDRVAGLVLAATTDRFQRTALERAFFAGLRASMYAARGAARSSRATAAARAASRGLDLGSSDRHAWALREFRSTGPLALTRTVAALGRHHSGPWLRRIDVPTAVVVMAEDRVIPPSRQRRVAQLVPGATRHEVAAGHAGCVLGAERFVPAFCEAARVVQARVGDRRPGS